jgi:hypothetical protein
MARLWVVISGVLVVVACGGKQTPSVAPPKAQTESPVPTPEAEQDSLGSWLAAPTLRSRLWDLVGPLDAEPRSFRDFTDVTEELQVCVDRQVSREGFSGYGSKHCAGCVPELASEGAQVSFGARDGAWKSWANDGARRAEVLLADGFQAIVTDASAPRGFVEFGRSSIDTGEGVVGVACRDIDLGNLFGSPDGLVVEWERCYSKIVSTFEKSGEIKYETMLGDCTPELVSRSGPELAKRMQEHFVTTRDWVQAHRVELHRLLATPFEFDRCARAWLIAASAPVKESDD